ncbi:MAG: hypothetical protein AAF570_19090, partial [Bacteroidota bacterium]
ARNTSGAMGAGKARPPTDHLGKVCPFLKLLPFRKAPKNQPQGYLNPRIHKYNLSQRIRIF